LSDRIIQIAFSVCSIMETKYTGALL